MMTKININDIKFFLCIVAGMSSASNQPRVLQVGDSKDHPSHIPEHLPAFPDPHTYIQTLVSVACVL